MQLALPARCIPSHPEAFPCLKSAEDEPLQGQKMQWEVSTLPGATEILAKGLLPGDKLSIPELTQCLFLKKNPGLGNCTKSICARRRSGSSPAPVLPCLENSPILQMENLPAAALGFVTTRDHQRDPQDSLVKRRENMLMTLGKWLSSAYLFWDNQWLCR